MDRPETVRLLLMAHDEIIRLRRQVADLEPKAHAYDTLAIIARQSVHPQPQGYGEDIAWRLKTTINELLAESSEDPEKVEGES